MNVAIPCSVSSKQSMEQLAWSASLDSSSAIRGIAQSALLALLPPHLPMLSTVQGACNCAMPHRNYMGEGVRNSENACYGQAHPALQSIMTCYHACTSCQISSHFVAVHQLFPSIFQDCSADLGSHTPHGHAQLHPHTSQSNCER
jgi:hypothetical protein